MVNTQISTYINSPNNAYSYLTFLSDESKQMVAELQIALKGRIGDGLWLSNLKTLHITLAEIIETKPYPVDKQQLFEAYASEYKKLPAKILRGAQPISVTFDTIHVSPQAIIIKGHDDGSYDKIRQQLIKKLPFPVGTKSPPDIIHSTIARFTGEIDMEKLKHIIAGHSIDLQENVTEFMLVNNQKTPLEEYKILRTYRLRQ